MTTIIKWYKLNPLYWMSKYFGFGIYSQSKEINYIERLLKDDTKTND
jgi:hypothetical protein